MPGKPQELIYKLLREKVVLKQEVFERTRTVFVQLKEILQTLFVEMGKEIKNIDKEILLEFKDKGDFEMEFTLADDTLVFMMHTNVFTFDHDHEIWKSSYVQEDPNRSFCGKIYIYNFLSDSFKYNRTNDIGLLIARLFVNKDGHFFVEGKRQLGFLYNDFSSAVLDTENLRKVVESAILYSLDFDPYIPPYEQIVQISVQEVMESTIQSKIATGKRLGFKFSSDANPLGMP
ncbi:MAG: hypothetical protein IPG90_17470 [Bacteroidetes bacterium]|jgi:hypothetical protein|nr:hypothetical protein [Bacteroidota bacterium]MBP6402416.1 hypothetical protein [Bacteroidia bacterium]MBK6839839.1 hypothetical protein [Bacteroidota bacterium]MBK9525217.1 hypothetical protein [Bacteroidota bacterium]MBK9543322.1 hypothetical protein [Bacteroidota bacterium]